MYYISVQYSYVLGETIQNKRKYPVKGGSKVKTLRLEEIKKQEEILKKREEEIKRREEKVKEKEQHLTAKQKKETERVKPKKKQVSYSKL